jgi:hypothetical protein
VGPTLGLEQLASAFELPALVLVPVPCAVLPVERTFAGIAVALLAGDSIVALPAAADIAS